MSIGRSVRPASIQRLLVALAVVTLLATVMVAVPASEGLAQSVSTFVVDSTADEHDANVGDGQCDSGAGCTLRAAVDEANATTDAVIIVPAGVYTLTRGQFRIDAPTTIIGAAEPPGTGATTVDAARGGSRVFDVSSSLVLDGLVLENGLASQGGGIRVAVGASLVVTNSTVRNNQAVDGGGIWSKGTLSIDASTISGNTASRKGGGMMNGSGAAYVTNSTFVSNTGKGGAAVHTSGVTDIVHTTITANTSTNKNAGGVHRSGGSVRVKNSIVAGNFDTSVSGHDCSGTPDLLGLNFVGSTQGCNPVDPVLTGDPQLGPLADNGGPTLTRLPDAASPVVDAVTPGACTDFDGAAVAADQRGIVRPGGAGCELGAVELSRLSLSVSLTSDETIVGVGAQFIPVQNMLAAATATLPPGTPIAQSPVASIPVASIPVASIDPVASPVASIMVESLPVASIATAAALLATLPVASIPLEQTLLSDVPLLLDGGWPALLVGTIYEDVPLQAITLGDALVLPEAQTLAVADLDFRSTPVASIPVASIVFGTAPVASIALNPDLLNGTDSERLTAWCAFLGQTVCDSFGIDPNDPAASADINLLTLALGGVGLQDFTVSSVPVASIDPVASPVASIPVASIDWVGTPIGQTPVASIPVASIGDFIDCSSFDCTDPTATLADAAQAGALLASALLGQLLGLEPFIFDAYSVADLLFGILAPTDIPWETIDLQTTGIQNAADPLEPAFHYITTVDLDGPPSIDLTIELTLPSGFAYEPGSATFGGSSIGDPQFDPGNVLVFAVAGVEPGSHELSVAVRAGLVLGDHTASVTADAVAPGQTETAGPATTTVTVIESQETGDLAADLRVLQNGVVNLSHVSTVEDIGDLYMFTVDEAVAATGASASILLSNLDDDFDLVLYAPPTASIRGEPTVFIESLGDQTFDLDPSNDVLETDTLGDIALDLPERAGFGEFPVRAISAKRGTADELIETGTLRAGDYFVQISGYNGATSDLPFVLRMRLRSGKPLSACQPPSLPFPMPGSSTPLPASYPAEMNTVFLYNSRHLEAAFGALARADIEAQLAANANQAGLGVVGGVVPVDADPDVWSSFEALAADSCDPAKANDVVSAIGNLIDGITAAHPTVENLVIVGDDYQIPFLRQEDFTFLSNESTFRQNFLGNNATVSALGAGLMFTDDAYATEAGIKINDHEIFLPELVAGRLVETPEDILGALQNFITYDGLLDPTTPAFNSGYDFLTDGAQAVSQALIQGGLTVDELISETWSRQDLIDALSTARSVAGINAHFDESRALPAIGNLTHDESDLFTIDDVPASLKQTLMFSMGCHAGFSASDVQLGVTGDWASTFAPDNLWVANTTYGYGDTDVVALSEKLVALFAGALFGPDSPTVGEALRNAKQEYAAQVTVWNAFDEKILQAMTMYGLPMYRVTAASPVSSIQSNDSAEALSTSVDPITGLTAAPFDMNRPVSPTSGPGVLSQVDTPNGSYYEVDGRILSVNYRPIQPVDWIDVSQLDVDGDLALQARDALILDMTSVDVSDSDPGDGIDGFVAKYFRPLVDLSAHEAQIKSGDATFPAGLQRIATYLDPDGERQRLLINLGQFRSGPVAGVGTQRLFTQVEGLVYYAPPGSTDTTAPLILLNQGQIGDGIAHFEVTTDNTATRVYILYQEDDGANWKGLDLVRVPGTDRWIGGRPSTATAVAFRTQVVDDAGNVSMSDRKGLDYLADEPIESDTIQFSLSGLGPINGWYGGDVVVTATSSINEPLTYSLDGAPFVPYTGPVSVTGDRGHVMHVIGASGAFAVVFFAIDSQAPQVTASADPEPDETGWTTDPVTVTISAGDGAGSGVATIDYEATGAETIPPTSVADDEAVLVIGADGVTTVSFSSTDLAGNTSAVAEITVNVDALAPSVVCDEPDGQWHPTDVTLTCTATDDDSGLADPGDAGFGLGTSVPDGTDDADASTNSRVVCDVAGNCTTAGPIDGNQVDKADPTVTAVLTSDGEVSGWNVGPVTADLSAADGTGSGVASINHQSTGAESIPSTTTPGDTASFVITSDGVTTVTYSALDQVGNDSGEEVVIVKIDASGPAITCDQPDGQWHGNDVTLACTAVDGESGLADPGDASFALATSVPDGVEDANAATDSRTVCDVVGNCTTVGPIAGNMVDKRAPDISIVSPSATSYAPGAFVLADYVCTDAGSGPAVCDGPVPNGNPIDTSTIGSIVFTVSAVDGVGNSASLSVTYEVNYLLCLAYDPAVAKHVGSTYPIKLRLCDADGNNLSSRNVVLTALLIDGTTLPPPNDAGNANQGFTFRFQGGSKSYIYNLDTTGLTPGPHTLDFTVETGGTVPTHSAPFTLE